MIPTTLAIMQNQWFKNPERMRRMLEQTFEGNRPRFIKTFLFWSCLSGQRLRKAFGEERCDQFIWEEASPLMGDKPGAVFPPDHEHLKLILETYKPRIVLAFGKVAAAGLAPFERPGQPFTVINGPHPAARNAMTVTALSQMAQIYEEIACRLMK